MVKKLQVSRGLLAAALALTAGGATAVVMATQPAGHAASVPAPASARQQSAQDAKARTALLTYLSKNSLVPRPSFRLGATAASTAARSDSQPGITQAENFQLSGYENTSVPGTFTAVSGSWRVPRTYCTKEQEVNSEFVGLDGTSAGNAESVGTLDYCYEGKALYFTWWDVYPEAGVTVSTTLQPGDLVTASVVRSGTAFTLSLTDTTDPSQSFSTTQTCTYCRAQGAQWIAERPFLPEGVAPLAPFYWRLTNASQTSNGVTGGITAGPNPTEVTMMDVTMGYPLDSVSDLRGGDSFAVRYLDSY
jgi:Peptidase A4 family